MTIEEIQKDINHLYRDQVQMSTDITRLDSTVEKLASVSADVAKLLAVQELKIDQHDKIIVNMNNYMEKRRDEVNAQLIATHDVDAAREDFNHSLKDSVTQLNSSIKEAVAPINNKVGTLEKFMYILSGMGVLIGLALGQVGNIIRAFSGP